MDHLADRGRRQGGGTQQGVTVTWPKILGAHSYDIEWRDTTGDTGDRRSEWSRPVSGTAHPTTAAPPDTVTATPGAGAIDVSWTPVTGPHTDTITRYALWVYDRSARMAGLTPGHHHVAFVCAWNAAGEGKPHIADPAVVR
ncbi:hypothetical protein [Streptomyces sp. NPDC092307]|uniref:hypothetical protein n=1 Tax=Streptomyces sp. NPDC092307 TaxID=3366013 RepID=UPI0037F1329A